MRRTRRPPRCGADQLAARLPLVVLGTVALPAHQQLAPCAGSALRQHAFHFVARRRRSCPSPLPAAACSRCGRVGNSARPSRYSLRREMLKVGCSAPSSGGSSERHCVVVDAADDVEGADVPRGELVRAAAQLQSVRRQQHLVAWLAASSRRRCRSASRFCLACAISALLRARSSACFMRSARWPAAGTVAGRASSSTQSMGSRASVPYTSVNGAAPVDACCLLLKASSSAGRYSSQSSPMALT